MFPADNAWNQDISAGAAAPELGAQIIAKIQADGGDNLHPDFGENPDYGIPFVVVPATNRSCRSRTPPTATRAIRGRSRSRSTRRSRVAAAGGDRHVLVLRAGHVRPVRAVRAVPLRCGLGGRRGARFDLTRTRCGRSAGRAPTPPACRSCPGWCATTRWRRARSATRSASRSRETQRGYILPATHFASSTHRRRTCRRWGMRLRLKASLRHRRSSPARRG